MAEVDIALIAIKNGVNLRFMNSRKSGGSTRDVGLVKAHGCVNPVYPQPIGAHCEGIVRNRLYFHGQAHDAFVNSLVPADRLVAPHANH
jgi:hypothetical protein